MKANKIKNCILWVLCGFLFVFTVAFIVTGNPVNLLDINNNDAVFRMKTDRKDALGLKGCSFNEEKKLITVETQDAKITFQKAKKGVQYYYLNITASEMNRDNITVKFGFYDKQGHRIAEHEDLFGTGENFFTIPVAGEITRLKMIIKDQQGAVFRLENVEMREMQRVFSKKTFAASAMTALLFYLVISFCLIRVGKHDRGEQIRSTAFRLQKSLQSVYMLGEKPAVWLSGHLTETWRQRLRIALLTALCLYMSVVKDFEIYDDKDYYKYHMFFAVFVILIIGWLLYDGKLNYRKWNSPLAASWFGLGLVICFSDAIMGSPYLGTGYIMIFAFGSLFFFWSNRKKNHAVFLVEMAAGIGAFLLIRFAILGIRMAVTGDFAALTAIPSNQDLMIAWKSAIGELNFIGHSTNIQNGGNTVWPYNGLIQMIYRYGMVIIIPYILFIIIVLQHGARLFFMKKKRIGILVLAIDVIFIIMLFMTNLEQPFLSPVWLAFYLHAGYFFAADTKVCKKN